MAITAVEAALREDPDPVTVGPGRIELAYGTWLGRRRPGIECRTPLLSAAATLEQIGAAAWAVQARAELRAAGSHLYRLFPKLGIASRRQLAARLQEVGGAG